MYRYGFNGQLKVNEWAGIGNDLDYGTRNYQPRTGRFLSTDLAGEQFPWNSPYNFAENSPIENIDYNGCYKFDPYFQKQYPMVTNLLVHYIPLLKDNPQLKAAFMKATQYTEAQFDEMVTWNKGPWVTPTRESSRGNREPQFQSENQFSEKFPDNIIINNERFAELEQKLKELKSKGFSADTWPLEEEMFIITVAILHESAHRAWYQTQGPNRVDKQNGGDDRGYIATYDMFGSRFAVHDRLTGEETMNEEARQKMREYAKNNFGQTILFGTTFSPYFGGAFNTFDHNTAPVTDRDPTFEGDIPKDNCSIPVEDPLTYKY